MKSGNFAEEPESARAPRQCAEVPTTWSVGLQPGPWPEACLDYLSDVPLGPLAAMIIPVRCFTCGKVIGDKWDDYMSLLESGYTEK